MTSTPPFKLWLLGLTLSIGPVPALWAQGAAAGAAHHGHARPLPPSSLPSGDVLTNLRSPSGRTVYLLCHREETDPANLQGRVLRMAHDLGAQLVSRGDSDLWVAILFSREHGLTVHRLGQSLQVEATPLRPLPTNAVLQGNLERKRLRQVRHSGAPGRQLTDEDLDLETVLLAQRSMRSRETVAAGLVAQAQGAAARLLLHRYAEGDDLSTYLWGMRTMPLLAAHPDTSLLQRIVTVAQKVLDEPDSAEAPAQAVPLPVASAAVTRGPALAALLVAADETARAAHSKLEELARKRAQLAVNKNPATSEKADPAVRPGAKVVQKPEGGTAGTNIRSAVEDKDGIDP